MDFIYQVHNDYIDFLEYPFPCSSVAKKRKLKARDIVDATDKYFHPPAVRTKAGEVIFVPFRHENDNREDLLSFFSANQIPVKQVVDIWDMILDPFVDTEFSAEHIERTQTTLKKYGVDSAECKRLRTEVSARMVAYNFESCLWEWCSLGLCDVLRASTGFLSGEKHRLSKKDFKNFYWRAMEIALKGFA